jgi:ADP-heptose:LPS heptosyltransferase
MSPAVVRWLDKNIGQAACFILTLHRRLISISDKGLNDTHAPRRILFVKLTEQGSTVLAYRAFKKAADIVGRENVFIMVFDENRPILDILDVAPRSNIIAVGSSGAVSFLRSVIKAISRIRKEKIDACVDMEFFSRASAILSYATGAVRRVGLHAFHDEGPYRGDLFTHKLIYDPRIHTELFFLSLVEALNHSPERADAPLVFKAPQREGRLPEFSATNEERRSIAAKLKGYTGGDRPGPVIIFNPNIGDILPIRKWPEENFIKLGNIIRGKFKGAVIVITGTAKEKKRASFVASSIPDAVSLAGETSLRELLALFSIADLLVTNDSGPAHFAALTPLKTIVLFGPETPALYSPAGGNSEIVYSGLVCSPCINVYNYKKSPCDHAVCLKGITSDDVFDRVKKILKKPA